MQPLPAGVTVVVPVYNAEHSLSELVERLGAALRPVGPFEIIAVDDGSSDGSWAMLAKLVDDHPELRALRLIRNVGQHNALLAGIREARFAVTITIDDDLQHPPEEIPKLLGALTDDLDLVYGVPEDPQHGLWRNLASRVTKFALSRATEAKIAQSVSAFRVFRTDVRDAFVAFRAPDVSIDVLLSWGTTRVGSVPVRHDARQAGQSNYTFLKLVRHALNMVTGFSTWPLHLATIIGFGFTLVGIGVLVYVLVSYLAFGAEVPGFAFLASIVALFAGAQLFALGIIGEYLARMHLRTLDRPAYVVRTELPERIAPAIVTAPIEVLAFDTEWWGVTTARTTVALTEESVALVDKACEGERVGLLYHLAPSDDVAGIQRAERDGFFLMDIRLELRADLVGLPPGDDPPGDVRAARAADGDRLARIAAASHRNTRFFADANLPADRCEALYRHWILADLGGRADAVLVADEGSGAVGYVSLHERDGRASIGLIAVDEQARGSGTGGALVAASLAWARDRSLPAVDVVTQGGSLPAQRLYQRLGFRTTAVGLWFHRWFR